MSNTTDIKIAGTLAPSSSKDTYPTHYAKYGKGGFISVASLSSTGDLTNPGLPDIPSERIEEGMAVYVRANRTIYLKDSNAAGFVNVPPGWRPYLGASAGGNDTPSDLNNVNIGLTIPAEGKFTNLTADNITVGLGVDSVSLEELGIQKIVIKPTRIYVDSEAPAVNNRIQNNGQNPNIPFKSIERALLEAAKVSKTFDNIDTIDRFDKIAIVIAPGTYLVDNRPGTLTSQVPNFDLNPTEDIPLHYSPIKPGTSKNNFINAHYLIKLNTSIIANKAYTEHILNDTSLNLTLPQKNQWKQHLTLFVEALYKDLEAYSNVNSILYARTYKLPNNQLSGYIKSNEVPLFNTTLETAKTFALQAFLNVGTGGFLVEPKIGFGTNNIDPNSAGYIAVSDYVSSLTNLIKNALLTANPWIPTSNNGYNINTGLFATASSGTSRLNLNIFNPSKLIIKHDQSIMSEVEYQLYVSGAESLKAERTAILRNAFKTLTGNTNLDNTLVNNFITNGSTTFSSFSLTTTQVKCLRDLILIFDALHKDIINISNVHILDLAKVYIDPVGVRANFLTSSTADSEATERALMVAAIEALKTQALLVLTNTNVNNYYSNLVDIIVKTLKGDNTFVNPHTVIENEGVTILAGGVVVPKGVSFVSTDLRKTEIRPIYIGEDDPNYTTYAPIFKVTGGTYAYGMTFKDHPGAQCTHHKVVCIMFANDDWEFDFSSNSSYYKKVGKAFYNNENYYSITPAEIEIVGPASSVADRPNIDTVYGSSPYIYNCSVRSEWGMNGMWMDGARVKGFKSIVGAQITLTVVQKHKEAYEKWNDQLTRWEQLGANENYYDLTPALYSEYIHGISSIEQKPSSNAIRYKRSRLIGGSVGTDWRNFGFLASNNAFSQLVTCFCIGVSEGFVVKSGGDMSISNATSNFGETSLAAYGKRTTASNPDKDFTWVSIIPPSTLSSGDIVNFNTFTPSIDFSYSYYSSNNSSLNRVYVTQPITNSVIFPFTFKAGSNIYLTIGTRIVSATLTTVNGLTFNSETVNGQTLYYFNVQSNTNNIFTYLDGTTVQQIFDLSGSSLQDKINTFKSLVGANKLYIKRLVDNRKVEDKTYRLKLTGANKRIPGYGFMLNTSNGTQAKLWVSKSEEVDVLGSIVYKVTLLSFKPDGSPVDNIVTPYKIEDLDYEPVVNNQGKISFPSYNSPDSPTYRAVLELVKSISSLSSIENDLLNPSDTEINLQGFTAVPTIEFLRPSVIRSSGHTFDYVGFLNYSQGLINFQSVTVPVEARLTKNRKNINGGKCFYSGLDHEGLSWAGDVAVNIATGESISLAVNETVFDITVPASFSNVSVERIATTNGNVVITDAGIKLDNNSNITFGSSPFYIVTSPPTSTTVPVGTLALNSSPTDNFPFAYKLINDAGVLKWIELGSDTYNNITLTGNFKADSQGSNIDLSPKKDVSDTPNSGVVKINPQRYLEIKPGNVGIHPQEVQGTLDNVRIGHTQPAAAVFSHITTGNTAESTNAAGDAYIRGKATIIGDLVVNGGFRLENAVGGFSSYQIYITDLNEVMDSFSITMFRSARYQVQVSQDNNHQTFDMLVMHDNTAAYYIEYGNISSNFKLVTPHVSLEAGHLKVKLKRLTPSSSCNVAFTRTILKTTLISPTNLSSTELQITSSGDMGASSTITSVSENTVLLEDVPIPNLTILFTITEDTI